MSSTESKMAMAKTVISTVGSVAAAAMVVRSVAREYLPPEMKEYLSLCIRNFINRFSTQLTLVIYESVDGDYCTNEIYAAVQSYLATKITPANHRLTVSKHKTHNKIDIAIESEEAVQDIYNGVKFHWVLVHKRTPKMSQFDSYNGMSTVRSEERSFELSFHRKHKEMAVDEYLPFILKEAKLKKESEKILKIFTVHGKDMYSSTPSTWTPVNLDHPATFETLAMDADVKESIMKDLDRFVRRREYYRKVGKAWKRGYLLYGPPGTGKSSLIAAIANYLKFDIYDLELTDIKGNSELRQLLVATANRSILVVEDIDCSAELHDRVAVEALALAKTWESYPYGYSREETKVTLSGFLNFIDGLWSSCGDERIIIFTTNRKDKLDPALLRPGRMDIQIHMSYCTPYGFHLLASNYLGITGHNLFEEIEQLIQTTEVTPAEVAEQLLKDDNPDNSLGGLVEFLHGNKKKKKKAEEDQVKLKAKKEDQVNEQEA